MKTGMRLSLTPSLATPVCNMYRIFARITHGLCDFLQKKSVPCGLCKGAAYTNFYIKSYTCGLCNNADYITIK